MPPDFAAIDSREKGGFGYKFGKGASADVQKNMNDFIKGLGDGSINLLKGPIKFQDGTDFIKDGQTGKLLDMWYLPQLVAGMEGKSK
jgi:simple sugar transport system substrate-binding protein